MVEIKSLGKIKVNDCKIWLCCIYEIKYLYLKIKIYYYLKKLLKN